VRATQPMAWRFCQGLGSPRCSTARSARSARGSPGPAPTSSRPCARPSPA